RTNPYQIRKCHHDKRDVSIPASEAAHFVVVQSHVFGMLKILFDTPTGSAGLDHLWQGGSFRSKDKVVPLLLWVKQTAADEQEVAPIIFPAMQCGDNSPMEASRTFGPFAHREAIPLQLARD